MNALGLTPTGNLRWDMPVGGMGAKNVDALHKVFASDWREGLFRLAADKTDLGAAPGLRYWQGIAEHFLTQLCHLAQDAPLAALEPPAESVLAHWVLSAPPMSGGEYLSPESLLNIWECLAQWCADAAGEEQGLHVFLSKYAPKWKQVGRVCFHLAENKTDAERPFAFMATYVSGLAMSGQARHLPLGKALEQYAGAKNHAALIHLLAPVQAASEQCAWVKELLGTGDIYQPLAWTTQRAHSLLLSVPALEECGLVVRLPDWWRKRPRPKVSVNIGEKKPSLLGLNAIVDFDVSVALGGAKLSAAEIRTLLAGEDGLVMFKGQWVEVDREKLREALEHWETIRANAPDAGISFIEGMRLLAGAPQNLAEDNGGVENREWAHVQAGQALRELLDGLRNPAHLEEISDKRLKATLRPYQKSGAAWLHFLTELGLGACLADDMGLGKTMQVLTLLLYARQKENAPSLLVAPASLLGNWRAEAQRFAPSLRLTFLHPSETEPSILKKIGQAPAKELANTDLAVTTYSMLARQEWLGDIPWRLIIVDEAQAIKNPGTKQAHAIKKLSAHARIALTGTPVENRLGDLWSLFDFINPGLLGSAKTFKSFANSLQKRQTDQYAPLRHLVAPYILRRLKTDRSIISDLPDKVETTQFCKLTKAQVRLYEKVVDEMKRIIATTEGIKRRGLILQTLMRLKQVCNHPDQLTGNGEYSHTESGKFLRLTEICDELAGRQERVLVFTQFREIIPPLASHLAGVFGKPGLSLHGQVPVRQRKRLVDQFQRDDGPPYMILSLKAGGTGLNLTAASHVIHFDRWWNPAVEDQATDRAFRIGQHKNVLVHKFVTNGTIEEKIDLMIAEKKQLTRELLGEGNEVDITSIGDDALMELVRLDIRRASL